MNDIDQYDDLKKSLKISEETDMWLQGNQNQFNDIESENNPFDNNMNAY